MNLNKINNQMQLLIESTVLEQESNGQHLYHGTHIKNLESIQKHGLIPDFGDVIKSTEAWEYFMDDNYTRDEDRFDGILFFSDNPDTWSYSHFGGTPNVDEAVLVIVENNDTIYRKAMGQIYDSEGNVDVAPDYYDAERLPSFIEDGDYFSFQEQEPIDILYGDRLKEFLEKH